MALSERQITLRFTGGVETKADAKVVPSTKLLALENGVFTKAISVAKRNGYAARGRKIHGSRSLLSGCRRLSSRIGELIAFTADRALSYQPSSDAWQDTGAVFSATCSTRPAVRTGTMQTVPDHAQNGGLTAYAWEDSRGGVWWSAVYTESGQVCRGPEQLDADGESPRCVAAGDVIHVYWSVPTTRFIQCAVVNPARPEASPRTTLIVDDLDSTDGVYDVCPTGRPGSPTMIAWKEHLTTNVRVGYVDASGVLGSPVTGHPSVLTYAATMAAGSPIAVGFSDATPTDYLTVGYVETGTLHARVLVVGSDDGIAAMFVDDLLQPFNATTDVQRMAIAMHDGGTAGAYVVIEEAAAQATERYCRVNAFANSSGSATTLRSVGLASRGFVVGDDAFATFVHDATYFNTALVLRLSDFAPVGRLLPGSAAGAPARPHLPSAHVADDVVRIALPQRTRLTSENADTFTETGIALVELDFDSEDSHVTATLGRGLYMAGACPLHYDGKAWTELGFHVGPEHIVATPAGSTGSMTSSVTYLYRVWYEWTDAQGEIHRGPTSIGTSVVMGASDTHVTLTLPTLRVTSKSNVRICVARGKANDETALYRVTSMDATTDGDPNGYVANDPTVDSVSFVDNLSDATLASQEPLYTNGGLLSNDPAPFGDVLASGKARLFWTDPGDGNTVRFSQPLDDGYGVECPPDLAIGCDPFGGDVRALAVMDDALVIFKESAIYLVLGDGPLPNGFSGDGAGFTSAALLTSDVGCTDPNSVALTPVGLVFKSAKGIYLLGRDRAVAYVGAPVEAYNGQSIRRATVLPDRTAVVFLTDSGKTLLWDYFYQQWSTFTNHEGYDSVVALGAYHYLRTDERIFVETVGEYVDDRSQIRLRLETAWIHMQEHLQGFQRFYELHLIGERKSPHQLSVQYRVDYGGHWSEPVYLDATGQDAVAGWVGAGSLALDESDSLVGTSYGDGEYGDGPYGGFAPGVYQWRIHVGERAQAIQFRFEDVGGEGAGYELTEMTITGGVKANTTRPFAASRSA